MLQTNISFLFYLTFAIYIFMGTYAITLNKEERLNQVFLFMCLSFSIWGFAFTLANSAVTSEEALIWRRFSSMGWGVAYSIVLHFTLVLTNEYRLLKKKWIYIALYLPSVINVCVFGLIAKIANKQYELLHTSAGWAVIHPNNIWDHFFNVYYISYSLITLVLLIRWMKTTHSKNEKKYAIYLIVSFGISLFLGTLTDTLANRYLTDKLPSLAPIVIMIPIMTINYIIRKYGLMVPKEVQKFTQEGVILSRDNRIGLFKVLALSFFVGGVGDLFLFIQNSTNWTSGILPSTILIICGSCIYALPYTVKTVKQQEYLLTMFFAAAILSIMTLSYHNSMSNIVWPIPLFFLMLTVVFNNNRMFYLIVILCFGIGVWSWIYVSDLKLTIGPLAHILRITYYLAGICFAIYANRIFVSRLKENEKQVVFQKMISSISTNFVNINGGNFNEKVTELLKKSGEYTNADRSYVAMFSKDQDSLHFTQEWIREGFSSLIKNTQRVNTSSYKWSLNKIQAGEIVFIPSVEYLSPEAQAEKRMMLSQKIQSLVFIPIINKEKAIGLIGFDQINDQKGRWLEDHELLKVLANIVSDAYTKIEVEKEVNYLAYFDSLTGLPNRTLFINRIKQAIDLAKRSEKNVGVIFLDLDGFKSVNDTLGHDWGDNLLLQVGERLSGCIRKYDTAARFGGDEFLIMVPQIDSIMDMEKVAKKVMAVFETPIIIKDQEFFITASMGISMFPLDGEDGDILIKNADLAMYHAKGNGKNQYSFCSESMKEDVMKKMKITNSLYRALDRNEFYLQYQPQVCLKNNEIIGFEALARWIHPELGFIPPNMFIPIAEQTGLINSIGEWILMTACRQNKMWQDMGMKPVQVAVNISIEQFRSGNLIDIVTSCLKETGLDPKYLELEITEGIAMKESHYIVKTLQKLKEIGVCISIDDFGVEYSSLSRLKDMPVDKLKMDMQFVRGISVSSKDESIISVIIHLAKSLGIKVIAEGVETEEQINFLASNACDEVQGYYFYKPMLKNEIETKLFNLKGN